MTAQQNIFETLKDSHQVGALPEEGLKELARDIALNLGLSNGDDFPDWNEQ